MTAIPADIAPLVYMLLGGLGSLLMWLVLGPAMTGLGVKRLAKKAAAGDPKALEFFFDLGDVLMRWAGQPRIKTGRKVKPAATEDDPDPKAVDEILTPVEYLGRVISNYMINKLKASKGGSVTQAAAAMADIDPQLATMMALGGRRKDQSAMDYAFEQMLPRFMPQLEQKIAEILNKRQGGY